jgi:hypothetical protein
MTDLSKRIQNLQDKLQNIHTRLTAIDAPTSPSTLAPSPAVTAVAQGSSADAFAQIKRSHLTGSIHPLRASAIHAGNPEANLRLKFEQGNISALICIDDLLDESTQELSYRISNFDPKTDLANSIGVVYHINGTVSYEQIALQYDLDTQTYRLNLSTSDEISAGRILIVAEFKTSLANYVDGLPVITSSNPSGPGGGSMSRPA